LQFQFELLSTSYLRKVTCKIPTTFPANSNYLTFLLAPIGKIHSKDEGAPPAISTPKLVWNFSFSVGQKSNSYITLSGGEWTGIKGGSSANNSWSQ
jgi:hypothetical protein